MTNLSLMANAVLMAYDFTGIASIVYIGGVRANSWERYWSWIQR